MSSPPPKKEETPTLVPFMTVRRPSRSLSPRRGCYIRPLLPTQQRGDFVDIRGPIFGQSPVSISSSGDQCIRYDAYARPPSRLPPCRSSASPPCTRGFETLVCLCSSKGRNFLHQINDDANLRQAGREGMNDKFGSMSISCHSPTTPIFIPHQPMPCCCSGKHSVSNPVIHPLRTVQQPIWVKPKTGENFFFMTQEGK